MSKRVYMSEVEGQRGRERSPYRWRDGVRRACADREMGTAQPPTSTTSELLNE